MRQYFIHDGQNQVGPFSLEQLKQQSLRKDTSIWYNGLGNWTTAGELEELQPLFANPTPPSFENAPPVPSNTAETTNTYEEVLPEKKRSLLVPIMIGAVIIIGGLIAWMAYQNEQQTERIGSLQEKVTIQDNAIQAKQIEETTKQAAETAKQNEALAREAEKQKLEAALLAKNMNYRRNWHNYIKLSNSEPVVDYALGGIGQFNVYVSNDTEYKLEQVDVLVQYIRKSGQVWQIKKITLFNVAPNSVEGTVAPSSVNGVKVFCSIEKIISNKMNFCYPSFNGGEDDFFFCK